MATIILVDDESTIRDLTSIILKKEGHQIFGFERGQDAIDYLQDNTDTVDLLITDLIMPTMQGDELIHAVHEITPQLPCIIISASVEVNRLKYEFEGRALFLSKPFQYGDLVDMVKTSLK